MENTGLKMLHDEAEAKKEFNKLKAKFDYVALIYSNTSSVYILQTERSIISSDEMLVMVHSRKGKKKK
jgi:hypothetical protein